MRTIDAIDSTYSLVGDRFQASLEEPLTLEGNVVVARDALVYGRLTQAKESGTFAGRSQAASGADRDCGEWKDGARGDGRI